jgi:hypothetical protein
VSRRTVARTLLVSGAAAGVLGSGAVQAAPSTVGFAAVAPAFGGEVPVRTLPSYGVRGMHVLGYVHQATTELTLPVHNTGRLPVTVTSLELAGLAPLLALQEVRGLPLALAPGESAQVRATALLANCRFTHERELEVHDGLRIGFRVLGAEGVRQVPFDHPVMVHSPMIVGCPERKLDRQANDRSDLLDAP